MLTKTQAKLLAAGLGIRSERRRPCWWVLVFVLGFMLGSFFTASVSLFP